VFGGNSPLSAFINACAIFIWQIARAAIKNVEGNVKSATKTRLGSLRVFCFWAIPDLFTNAAAFYVAIKIFYCSWRKFKATIKRKGSGRQEPRNSATKT